jgi:hypothetical protein
MTTPLYIAARNFDGTGISPLYYSASSINNGQQLFLVPTGNIDSLLLGTTTADTATFCDGTSAEIYIVNGLYAFIQEGTGFVVVTVNTSNPDNRYYQLYLTSQSGIPMLVFSTTDANLLTPSTVNRFNSAFTLNYLTVTESTAADCTSVNYIGGTPIMNDGVVYLANPKFISNFYTTAVDGPSVYMVVQNNIFSSLNSTLQSAVVAGPTGETVETYIDTLLGIVPTATTPISTTPSGTSGSTANLTPQQLLAIKQKSKTISTWIMIGTFIILGAICLIAIIIYIATLRRYPTYPLKYDEDTKTLNDFTKRVRKPPVVTPQKITQQPGNRVPGQVQTVQNQVFSRQISGYPLPPRISPYPGQS